MAKKLRIGIIGGSGLEDALGAETGETLNPDTPFGPPSSPITLTEWGGVEVAILQRHGPGHVFNPSRVPYRANIYALKAIGCTHVVASGATGSLRAHVRPGDLVIADQVIDKTFKRESSFYEKAAVHVEMADPFCPLMRRWLIEAATGVDDIIVHGQGTYVVMEGPAFSTRAESNLHRQWGGDLIGMTVMPEAKLAKEAELPYALIALPTDYDCWKPHNPDTPADELLSEIIGNLKQAVSASVSLLKAALANTTLLEAAESPWASALKLAIWTKPQFIDEDEKKKLDLLWGKYVGQ